MGLKKVFPKEIQKEKEELAPKGYINVCYKYNSIDTLLGFFLCPVLCI